MDLVAKPTPPGKKNVKPFVLKLSAAGTASFIAACIISTYIVTCLISSSYSTRARLDQPLQSYKPSGLIGNHCAGIPPIHRHEFLDRQRKLAELLHTLNGSAYIAEPGANALFYFNVSTSNWKLSERPLLLILTPSDLSDTPKAKVSVLAPKFEGSRARMLPIPVEANFIEWHEDESPYSQLAPAIPSTIGNIFVDGSIRKFIADGLQQALPNARILTSPHEIDQLRERKSNAQLDILRCANEATLLAIREVHKNMYIGIRESEARNMMAATLTAAGLKNGGCLTLFGENAALPHGSGTDRALSKHDFALFDCTASLHGYWSDVTRTVALPDSQIPEEHSRIWHYVRSAQTVAIRAARSGVSTNEVDEASRIFLEKTGYARYFTHRLGHGIGLELHEEPYLHGGSGRPIAAGHSFSNEPGIYIEGRVGVRLEDCFFINETGNPVFFTQRVGGQSKSPWAP